MCFGRVSFELTDKTAPRNPVGVALLARSGRVILKGCRQLTAMVLSLLVRGCFGAWSFCCCCCCGGGFPFSPE